MADGVIKHVWFEDIQKEYDIVDEYARNKLEGLGTAFVIDATEEPVSTHTYRDYWTGAPITYATIQNKTGNTSFFSGSETLTQSISVHPYLILYAGEDATSHQVITISKLTLGDTVYVLQYGLDPFGAPIVDRWVSAKSSTEVIFSALHSKVDFSKLYTGNASPENTGSTDLGTKNTTSNGAHEANGSGELTIDKLAPTVTGSSHGSTSSNTGLEGAHTVDGSNFTFNGTEATFTSNVSVGDHSAQTLTASGSQSVGNHSHSIGKSTTSITYVSDATVTGSKGDHTHSITPTKDTKTVVTSVDATTGPSGSHSHTVELTSTAKTVVNSIDANTGAGSAHHHSIGKSTIFINHITGATSTSGGGHTHSVDTHVHGDDVNAYTSLSSATIWVDDTDGTLCFDSSVVITGGNTTAVAGTPSVTTINTSSAGGHSHPINLSSSSKTVVASIDANTGDESAHTHSINKGTISINHVTGATTYSSGEHNHSVGSTTDSITYVADVTITGSAGAHTHSITPTKSTQTVVTDVDTNTGNGGAHTVQGSNFKVTVPTYTHNVTNGIITYTPAGTISGSQSFSSHSHSYDAPSDHTHSITRVTETFTIPVSVAVSSHTHSVTIGSHTHSHAHTHSIMAATV